MSPGNAMRAGEASPLTNRLTDTDDLSLSHCTGTPGVTAPSLRAAAPELSERVHVTLVCRLSSSCVIVSYRRRFLSLREGIKLAERGHLASEIQAVFPRGALRSGALPLIVRRMAHIQCASAGATDRPLARLALAFWVYFTSSPSTLTSTLVSGAPIRGIVACVLVLMNSLAWLGLAWLGFGAGPPIQVRQL